VLGYNAPERARPSRTGRPQKLKDSKVDEIIEYCSESWDQIILDYNSLVAEFKLECTASTLQKRLHQRGYFRCTAQVVGRLLWAITHIFWHTEWLKVLWSDEVTFLVGGTRKRGERTHPTCIQHQFHRGHTTPVNAWGAIGYGYKSQLIFLHGSGKIGAFTQKDYLAQILEPHI
jgi:hypothetical protein